MTKSLAERLQETRVALTKCETSLSTSGDRIPVEAQKSLELLLAFQREIADMLEALQARDASFALLDGLERHADDGSGAVAVLGHSVKFQHLRLIAMQGYLAIQWSIADRITEFVGRVLLPKPGVNNSKDKDRPPPIQLLSHFVGGRAEGQSTAGLIPMVRSSFGWPLAISYELRNVFAHLGGQVDGIDLFEGGHHSAAFRVSKEGWDRFQTRLGRHQLKPEMHRRGPRWPAEPIDDLRPLLRDCEADLDDALGMLVRSASLALMANVSCLLGTD